MLTVDARHRASSSPCHGIRAKRADLNRDASWSVALGTHFGGQLSLEHRPDERCACPGAVDASYIRDERRRRSAPPPSGRSRESDRCAGSSTYVGFTDATTCCNGGRERVGCVDRQAPRARRAAPRSRHPRAPGQRQPTDCPSTTALIWCAARQRLCRRHRLQRRAIQRAVALLGNDENHSARASSRRRRTSSLAASGAEPVDHLGLLAASWQRQRDDLLRPRPVRRAARPCESLSSSRP